MPNANKKNWIVLLVIVGLLLGAGYVYWVSHENKPAQSQTEFKTIERLKSEPEQLASDTEQLPEGVSAEFIDSTEIQVGWMNHARKVLINNLPENTTSANFQNVFFHRGFKGWAVTCGEVELVNDSNVVEGYQRFIFPGVQTIYYENQIHNFDIYWDKVCVQKSDAYIPERYLQDPPN